MPESALQKLTIAQVAHRRKIQEGTVMAYLAEAITAGYGYNWPVAGCSEAAIPPLARLAKRLLIAAGGFSGNSCLPAYTWSCVSP